MKCILVSVCNKPLLASEAPDILFFVSSKTSAALWNSNLLNKYRGELLPYYLSLRQNIKLIAAKHFKD